MLDIKEILIYGLFSACMTAFIIILIGKLRIREIIVCRAPKLISQLFNCDFCISFWLSLIISIIFVFIERNISILFVPLVSTPIARVLI